MLAYKIQTPGNYPEESIQHSEQDENLKARMYAFICISKMKIFSYYTPLYPTAGISIQRLKK